MQYYEDQSPPPDGLVTSIQSRQKNQGTYVQRFKVLRDRNKNLPRLDFNAKATGVPKKFQDTTSFSRSYTYDSIKLPSISTCSVVTGFSGKSVHSDGYRRQEARNNRSSIQVLVHFERWKYHSSLRDQMSESLTDLSSNYTKDFHDISLALSKSLQNLSGDKSKPQLPPTSLKLPQTDRQDRSRQKYERITYQKHLSKRNSKHGASTTTRSTAAGSIAASAASPSVPTTSSLGDTLTTSDTNTLTPDRCRFYKSVTTSRQSSLKTNKSVLTNPHTVT